MRIGMPWYKREEYDRIKAVMEDGDKLPETYDEFLAAFESGCQYFRKHGHLPMQVYINPDTFPEWCRQNNFHLNAFSRITFARECTLRFTEDD